MRRLLCLKSLLLSHYLWSRVLSLKTGELILSLLGAFWLFVEFLSFFDDSFSKSIKDLVNPYYAVGVAVLLAVFLRKPRLEITKKLAGTDVQISIKVGDIFSGRCACVIPTNTTFDTDDKIIIRTSIQGKICTYYFDDQSHLDALLEIELRDRPFTDLSSEANRKGKKKRYQVGDVARVSARGRAFYFLPMAHMNRSGKAETDLATVTEALIGLWSHFNEHGNYEEELAIPLLGTGAGRLKEPREQIAREIIDSFIAGCSQSKITGKLTVIIFYEDLHKFDISFEELGKYLEYRCKFEGIGRGGSEGNGSSLGATTAHVPTISDLKHSLPPALGGGEAIRPSAQTVIRAYEENK